MSDPRGMRMSPTRGWLLAAAATLALTTPGTAQTPGAAQIDEATLRAVDRFVEVHRSRFGWPGVALSIATADSVLLARGYGQRTVEGGPVTARTPFPLGSVTKTFTAFAVARLSEEGRIDLDVPVEAYLPDFSLGPPFRPRSITIRHLLHHRSGLRQWDGHDAAAQEEGRLDHLAPVGPPGGRPEYSSLNFMILGMVLEAVTGEPYGAHLRRVLFEPVGMDDAFVYRFDDPPSVRVQGHRNLFGFDVAADEPPPPPHLVPAGFAAASARDMGRYTGMLLADGIFDGTRVLEPETTNRLLSPMDDGGPAMAWGRTRIRQTLVFGHAGNTRTASARVRLAPERGYAITLLVNSNAGPLFPAPADMVDGVHAILDGETPGSLWPRERIFKALILLGTLAAVGGAVKQGRAWHGAGHPVGLRLDAKEAARLAFDLGGAAFLLFGLPRLLDVPLSTMIEYFPDVGIGLTVAAGTGAVGGLLRAFTASGVAERTP